MTGCVPPQFLVHAVPRPRRAVRYAPSHRAYLPAARHPLHGHPVHHVPLRRVHRRPVHRVAYSGACALGPAGRHLLPAPAGILARHGAAWLGAAGIGAASLVGLAVSGRSGAAGGFRGQGGGPGFSAPGFTGDGGWPGGGLPLTLAQPPATSRPGPAAVPEPPAATVLLFAVLALLLWRLARRRA